MNGQTLLGEKFEEQGVIISCPCA